MIIIIDQQFEVVEDWMEELVNKSLAKRTVTSEDVMETFYSIHNLQLTFLIEQTKDKSLEALHKKLVDRYGKVYKGRQCSPFLSAQLVKVFFQTGQALVALLLIMSAQSNVWNRNLPHFTPQIVLPMLLYEYKDKSLVKQMYTIILLLPVEFSTLPGHFSGNKSPLIEMVNFTSDHLKRRTLGRKQLLYLNIVTLQFLTFFGLDYWLLEFVIFL